MDAVGPYALEHRLGEGGMGVVWAARHDIREWSVALKRVVDTGQTGWSAPLAEVRAVAAMDHPHIVCILDIVHEPDALWIAMERAQGSLADGAPSSWAGVRVVLESVLRALAHAHARGVIHLDVKPENVLRVQSGAGMRWSLADFGLAHQAARMAPGDDRARGTPAFMAPEQFTGDSKRWGPATDLYAVGCLIDLLVSGRPPFEAPSVPALAQAHRFKEPGPLVPRFAVPERLAHLRARLLEKDPADRFLRAADALAELDALDPADGPPAEPQPSWRAETFAFALLDEPAPPLSAEHPPEPSRPALPQAPDHLPSEMVRRMVASPALLDVRVLPLVGRADALGQLVRALKTAVAEGGAHVVQLTGAPGIGRRSVARAFAWRADELGQALLQHHPADPVDERPVLALFLEQGAAEAQRLRDFLAAGGPRLALVCGDVPEGPVLARVELGPLEPGLAARLARNLAPLDEALVARLARTCGGHPGRIVARVRAWAAQDRLAPGPYGLVLAPDAGPDPQDWLDDIDPEDPLLPLAWSIEEDPNAALEQLDAAVRDASSRGTPGRALWLLALADRALASASRDDAELAWRVASLRVGTLNAMGHMEEAATASQEATQRARALGDDQILATALAQEAHITRFFGADPLPLLAEAEALSTDPLTVGRARATRGSVLIRQERLAEARDVLQSAADHLVAHGEKRFLGTTLYWLGNAWLYEHEVARALEFHRDAVAAFQDLDNAAGVAMTAVSAAQDALLLDQPEMAGPLIEIADKAATRTESPWMLSRVQSLRGWWMERNGDLDRAEAEIRAAWTLARETNTPDYESPVRLARVLLRQGRHAEAATTIAAVRTDDCPPMVRAELDALRIASLAPSDPEWTEALERCRSGLVYPDVRDTLVLARRRLSGDSTGAVDDVLGEAP